MARTVQDSKLQSREQRRQLVARAKPYYRYLEEGLHLGYRKLKSGGGNWVVRHYIGEQRYELETVGPADDSSDADGVKILNFSQAQTKARGLMVGRAHRAAGHTGPLTVRRAIDTYIEFLETNRKSAQFSRYAADAFILPALGNVTADKLTKDAIEEWHQGLTKLGARIRVRKGEDQRYKEIDDPEEHLRRRKSSANRILTVLKAALNRSWRDGKIPTGDAAWRAVEPFKSVDAARTRWLEMPEATRLLNAADEDFRRLARGALETGARYGELIRLQVVDFSHNAGTVAIRKSKSSKPRHIHLTDDGVSFFRSITAGRAGTQFLFLKANGDPWKKDHQKDPMRLACQRATIDPMGFHGLRHTWASQAVMGGVPLIVVAKNLGHSDTRMVEKHYGHLAPSYVADAIKAGAPRFGQPVGNVVSLADESS